MQLLYKVSASFRPYTLQRLSEIAGHSRGQGCSHRQDDDPPEGVFALDIPCRLRERVIIFSQDIVQQKHDGDGQAEYRRESDRQARKVREALSKGLLEIGDVLHRESVLGYGDDGRGAKAINR